MNENKNEVITGKQLMFSLYSILIGMSILSIPRSVVGDAGPDGWIVIIASGLVPLIVILSTIFLFRRFQGLDFYTICKSILGNKLSKLILFIYIIYGILFCAVILRLFSDMMDTFALPKTPSVFIRLLMMLTSLYIVLGGIKTVARLNEILFFLAIPLYFIILPSLKVAEWTFLLPIMKTPLNKFLMAAVTTSFSYTGFEYLFILYPFLKNKKSALKYSIAANTIGVLTYAYVTIMCTIILGPYLIKQFVWPTVTVLKTVDVPVIERLEFIFILLWVGIGVRPLTNQHFAVSYFLMQVMNIKKFKNAAIPPVILSTIIAAIPQSISETFKYSNYVGILGMGIGVILPVLLLFLSLFFKRSKQK